MSTVDLVRFVRVVVLLCVAALMSLGWSPALAQDEMPDANRCYNASGSPTVALDPGHGGSDPGTGFTFSDNFRLRESDVVLDIAQRTRRLLTAQGYRVCLTRIDDTGLGNTERAQYANGVGARVFVLVHLNGSSTPSVNYTQTFWGKKNKDLQFSNVMYSALHPALGIPGNGVGQFASGALLKANMPATLTESVFLTNPAEAEQLRDVATPGNRRDQIAQALANGVIAWLPR
jgi:N-acetylmuramoyl-L-alanine amidase